MIFAVEGHIEMIWNGLFFKTQKMEGINLPIVKTETRRIERGIYQVEAKRKKPHYPGYAVQRKRGVRAELDIRIVIDKIWLETCGIVRTNYFLECMAAKLGGGVLHVGDIPISKESAWAEGGYEPEQYEQVFQELNPTWNGRERWAFKFHTIEVRSR